MSNLHRIQWIDRQIRNQYYPNCRHIAEEFCLSLRQASRDIEYLRHSLDAPVAYSAQKNGYYYTDITFSLPSVFITDREKKALSYLAGQYQAAGDEFCLELAGLFKKLSEDPEQDQKNDIQIPLIPLEQEKVAYHNIIQKAVTERKKLVIKYLNAGDITSERKIHPYRISIKSSVVYCIAFCQLRKEIRLFRLSRIKSIRKTEQIFEIPEDYNPQDWEPDFSRIRIKPYKAVITMADNWHISLLPEKKKSLTEKSWEIEFYDSKKLLATLIENGINFQIIKPDWLKTQFRQHLEKIQNKF